jgi:transposase
MRKRRWKRTEKPEYDRVVHDVLHNLAGVPAAQIAKHTWVSPTTISNWRKGYENGGVRHPQYVTLNAVAKVAGMEFILTQSNQEPPSFDHVRRKNGKR